MTGVRGGVTAVDGASDSSFWIGVHLGRQAEAQWKVYRTDEAGFCQPWWMPRWARWGSALGLVTGIFWHWARAWGTEYEFQIEELTQMGVGPSWVMCMKAQYPCIATRPHSPSLKLGDWSSVTQNYGHSLVEVTSTVKLATIPLPALLSAD